MSMAQNEFAFNLLNEMEAEHNSFFSPTSIKVAFAMAYEGAERETKQQFEETFGFETNNEKFYKELASLGKVAKISNSIWIQESFDILESYISTINQRFGTSPYSVDFEFKPEESAEKINQWIEKSTHGMIKKIVSPLSVKKLKMALINAIYFKEKWKIPFNKNITQKRDFTNLNDEIVQVDMMRSSESYKVYVSEKVKVIEIPYENELTSMMIVLPRNMKKYRIGNKEYNEFHNQLRRQKVNLMLPKFTFESPTLELKENLEGIGFTHAFSNGANFSKMREENDLKIGTALHKAKIIINEEGTEAAASTVVGIGKNRSVSIANPRLDFIVNKPFIYIIKDNRTNAILFIGRMTTMS